MIIRVEKCNSTQDNSCGSESQIQSIFDEVYFTQYIVADKAELANSFPYRTENIYHSQFNLETSTSLDNNNFMQYNFITAMDEKLFIWRPALEFQFFKLFT